jgi:hypothetical protein
MDGHVLVLSVDSPAALGGWGRIVGRDKGWAAKPGPGSAISASPNGHAAVARCPAELISDVDQRAQRELRRWKKAFGIGVLFRISDNPDFDGQVYYYTNDQCTD